MLRDEYNQRPSSGCLDLVRRYGKDYEFQKHETGIKKIAPIEMVSPDKENTISTLVEF
jgi:hypothetical protein